MKTMKLLWCVWLCCCAWTVRASGNFTGIPLAAEGAWCWFADPRALHYENESGTINASYVGYIDVHGNIRAVQVDFLTGERSEVLVRSAFQPDDHNNPTFLVLPDERVLIIYSRHTDEAAFYYRVSRKPGDITMLGEEKRIATNHNTTYPSPFILSDDPGHFYLCWRGLGWHPTIARFTLPDELDDVEADWGPYQMVQSTGARPYAKYCSNGKDKIYVAYTTGHPDNEYPNWLYFNVVDLQARRDADGRVAVSPVLMDVNGKELSVIADGKFEVGKTDGYLQRFPATVVDAPEGMRDWVWQLHVGQDGMPAVAMVRIDETKRKHAYYYARWTGTEWRKSLLAEAAGPFHSSPTEYCYGGGAAIDPAHPETVYLSLPTDGAQGKAVHEIWKYTLDGDGNVAEKTQLTKDSERNNVRPFILPDSENSPLRVAWMRGDYQYWMVNRHYPKGYPTMICSDWCKAQPRSWDAPKYRADFAGKRMEPGDYESIALPKGKGFTICLELSLDSAVYGGTLLRGGNWAYGISRARAYPYILAGGERHASTNRLYTSDGWARHSTGTHGDSWLEPLERLVVTLVYDGKMLTAYRNGLIDQRVEPVGLQGREIRIGGYAGTLGRVAVYGCALSQDEVCAVLGGW